MIGDAAFDKTFLVEAAPADVIRLLLAEPVQKRLLALLPVSLHTTSEGLRLDKRSWIEDAAILHEIVDIVALVSAGIDEAFSEANRERQERAGYRASTQSASLDQARRAEVSCVKERKARRLELYRRLGWLFFTMVCLVFFFLWIGICTASRS